VPRKSPGRKRPARARRTARRAKSHPATRSRKRRKPRKHRLWRVAAKIGIAAILVWALVAAFYYVWALTFDLRGINTMPQRSAVFDRDGKFYSRLAGENRVVAPFDHVSNHFINALITREDSRFYSHHGVDPIGIARAVVRNLVFGGIRQGGSTITQQLARNSFPLGGRNLNRKLIEAALAFRIETELTKEQILEAYMNRIYFGSGCHGVDTASRAYFGKPASRLDLSEAALLAGLIRSPTRLSPFNDLDGAIAQRNVVLGRMRETGLIDASQLAAARNETIRLAPRQPLTPQSNWAMETIERELDLVVDRGQLGEGGLAIYTTIDPGLQQIAGRSLPRRIAAIESRPGFPHPARPPGPQPGAFGDASPWLQGALLAVDNRTGGIRAIVGGRDYADSKFNRAFNGRRQIGSTVKPFVYARAFERGIKPGDRVSDARLGADDIPRKYGAYSPANSDGKYGGGMRVSEALIHSRNTASVRVGMRTGLDAIAATLVRAGLAEDVPRFPSLCLGAFETTLKDLTAAYTAFATGGVRLQPYIIDHITDADGRTIYKATHGRLRVLDARAARATAEILEDVVRRGTASNARALGLRKRAAGKTGTTNDFVDAWFVGFTRSLTCGVWVGFDQPKTIMRGGTGAELALPIWVDFMQAADSSRYPDR